ncbi:hypothetical protein MKL27_02160 [Streptococcus suis]|nr:hypothetical protein [Streptococcus suis]
MNDSAKTKLQQALILLLDEEEFDRISVSKILKKPAFTARLSIVITVINLIY